MNGGDVGITDDDGRIRWIDLADYVYDIEWIREVVSNKREIAEIVISRQSRREGEE